MHNLSGRFFLARVVHSSLSSSSSVYFLTTDRQTRARTHEQTDYGVCYFPQQATIEWQCVSQTVGGLPTDPTTKEPQLGMIGQVGESVHDLWRLHMMSSAWYVNWKCSRGQRLTDLVTGGCLALRARSDHLNGILVRPERSWFTRTVPAWQLFCNTDKNYWINNSSLLKQ